MAVLTASFMGSIHCVQMCGGLVVSMAKSKSALFFYHLGRLFGYLILGFIAGFLGNKILNSQIALWVSSLAAFTLGFLLLLSGFRIWRGENLHFSIIPQKLLSIFYRISRGNIFVSGALSAFLPCGWLHSFVLGAIATQSAIHGAIFLFIFWIGTLPALSLAPWFLHKFIQPITQKAPKFAATLLILSGVFCIAYKLVPLGLGYKNDTNNSKHRLCGGEYAKFRESKGRLR